MKRVALIGHMGNMGRRYSCILDYFGIKWLGIEKGESFDHIKDFRSDGIILATPTDDHFRNILDLQKFDLPILCEKPVTRKMDELDLLMKLPCKLSVINQYAYIPHGSSGETVVNYYNTGKDGILWDCINIIGLASGDVRLSHRSPVWQVKINGTEINRAEVDGSYCAMLDDWLRNPSDMRDYIYQSHSRILEYEENKSCACDPSKKIFIETT